ncbi:MAG TPA: protein kinase [Roseiflexaceae bacterium]|nr:protein kinase [Roseiflexaceae bacterium]
MQETQQQSGPPTPLCPSCGVALRGQVAYCPACGAPLLGVTGRLAANQLLAGRYRVVQLLARGGMGAVYLAEDTRLSGARVAVKEMSGAFTRGDTEAFARAVAEFEREAAMLARLRHPHLPRVSDRFEEDGKHFLVMEYIHGQTLRAVIQQAGGRLPLEQALDYADQLCDVLAYLHSQQPPIIYRDLKPANVMIEGLAIGDWGSGVNAPNPQSPAPNSNAVLIDFGIARFYRPGGNSDTAVYGTIGYAPPEQYGKGQTDARTDIYALGVLLHQALTGYDPASSPFALPPLRALDPVLPAAVAAAIERATANDRAERFPDIAAFRAALRDVAPPIVRRQPEVTPPAPRPDVPAQTIARPPARRRAPIWAIALVALVLIGALLAFTLTRSPSETDSVEPVVAATLELAPTTEPQESPQAAATSEAEATSPGQSQPTEGPPREIAPLTPESVSASAHSTPNVDSQGNTVTYDPANAVDGKNDTTWRVDHDGLEQWLQLDFASEVEVKKIGIIPGYDKIDPFDGTDRFAQNRVVKQVRLEFSDGTSQEASFERQRDMQFVELPEAIRTRFVRIVITDTYPPPPAPDGRDFTPISEVVVEGTAER